MARQHFGQNHKEFNSELHNICIKKNAPFSVEMDEIIFMDSMVINVTQRARIMNGEHATPQFRASIMNSAYSNVVTGGIIMERLVEAASLIREELDKNKHELEQTVNEMAVLGGKIQELMRGEILNIRETRMAIVREAGDTLATLRDIRKFFLDNDYKTEMERLERFTKMAKDLKDLLDDGTLNATADIMLKLSDGVKR